MKVFVAMDLVEDFSMDEGEMNSCCSQFSYSWSESDVMEGVMGEGRKNKEHNQEELTNSEKASSVEEESTVKKSVEAKIDHWGKCLLTKFSLYCHMNMVHTATL